MVAWNLKCLSIRPPRPTISVGPISSCLSLSFSQSVIAPNWCNRRVEKKIRKITVARPIRTGVSVSQPPNRAKEPILTLYSRIYLISYFISLANSRITWHSVLLLKHCAIAKWMNECTCSLCAVCLVATLHSFNVHLVCCNNCCNSWESGDFLRKALVYNPTLSLALAAAERDYYHILCSIISRHSLPSSPPSLTNSPDANRGITNQLRHRERTQTHSSHHRERTSHLMPFL